MRKDPTEFRERFQRWKKGEQVYENGLALPAYEDGKTSINSPILEDFADPYEQLSPQDEEPVLTTKKKLPDEIVSRKTFTPQDLKNDIRDFYTTDFVQRRRNYHPEESAEQITNLFNVSPIQFGTLDSNTGGIHNKGNIIINNKRSDNLKRSTAVHEMRHVMDQQLEKLTPEELQLLHKAYDLKADKDYLHLENEYPTTNTELRYSISKDHNNAVGKDLDNVIKNISDEDLILRASMINGYNKIPDKTIKPKNSKQLLEQKTKADAIRKALMEVAYNSQKQDDRLIYAKDGKLPEYKGGKYPILGVGPILPSPLMAYILVKKGAQYLRDRAYKTVKPSGYNSQNIENFISNKNRMYTDPNTEALWGKYTNQDSVVADYTQAPKDMPIGRKMTRREMVNLGYNQNSLDLDNYAKYAVSDVIKPSSKKGAYEFIYPNTSGMVLHTPNNINDIPDDTWSHSHQLGTFHQTKGVDENGRYVSYEDTWDINPFRGKSSSDDPKLKYIIKAGKAVGLDQVGDIVPFGLPFEIYGKQYYDNNGRRIKK